MPSVCSRYQPVRHRRSRVTTGVPGSGRVTTVYSVPVFVLYRFTLHVTTNTPTAGSIPARRAVPRVA